MRTPLFVAAVAAAWSLSGCDWMQKKDPPAARSAAEVAKEEREKLQDACASAATYDRLKELAFDEAIRVRNADPVNLDTLATHAVVRMENPVVKSRDEDLNVTVCTGRFILELPPGAERAFGGERRLVADIEYAAQAAADGSGLVYQIRGAEPIIYKLAAFDLKGQAYRRPDTAQDASFAQAPVPIPAAPSAPASPRRTPPDMASREPAARPMPPKAPARSKEAQRDLEPARTVSARPSFNCRFAKTRGEKMVCGSDRLAALDRSMSSLYYSALSDASGRTRAELRRTRDRFLSYRDRCGSQACVADTYRGRMQEIRDIMADGE